MRDAARAYDLCAEVWAEICARICLGPATLPQAFGCWAVEVIADVLTAAAEKGEIPAQTRHRMGLVQPQPTDAEIRRIDQLRHPDELRAARDELPRDFSAAADRMLLNMPGPVAMLKIQSSCGGPS
jgi:hypothetical protein